MKWIDYREKLGIGFNDEEKNRIFQTRIENVLRAAIRSDYLRIEIGEYYDWCNAIGEHTSDLFSMTSGQEHIVSQLFGVNEFSLKEFISRYIALINCTSDKTKRDFLTKIFTKYLDETNIYYEIIEDTNDLLAFPVGAKELDDALVSDVLLWLEKYPNTHKTYRIALEQYCNKEYIRDIADNLRKSLEEFLREFLNNEKGLEANKEEICKYLGDAGVNTNITKLFHQLINTYRNYNNETAKHHDRVDERLLEFLLYQTGVLIRMVLVVAKGQKELKETSK